MDAGSWPVMGEGGQHHRIGSALEAGRAARPQPRPGTAAYGRRRRARWSQSPRGWQAGPPSAGAGATEAPGHAPRRLTILGLTVRRPRPFDFRGSPSPWRQIRDLCPPPPPEGDVRPRWTPGPGERSEQDCRCTRDTSRPEVAYNPVDDANGW